METTRIGEIPFHYSRHCALFFLILKDPYNPNPLASASQTQCVRLPYRANPITRHLSCYEGNKKDGEGNFIRMNYRFLLINTTIETIVFPLSHIIFLFYHISENLQNQNGRYSNSRAHVCGGRGTCR